jgi:hypothetical protein
VSSEILQSMGKFSLFLHLAANSESDGHAVVCMHLCVCLRERERERERERREKDRDRENGKNTV